MPVWRPERLLRGGAGAGLAAGADRFALDRLAWRRCRLLRGGRRRFAGAGVAGCRRLAPLIAAAGPPAARIFSRRRSVASKCGISLESNSGRSRLSFLSWPLEDQESSTDAA